MKHPEKMHILWTSGEEQTAIRMVMMYAQNSLKHDWWQEVEVIIWGAAASLAAENKKVRAEIAKALRGGVSFSACKACCDALKVSDELREMGVDVRYYGVPLTKLLREKENLLTI